MISKLVDNQLKFDVPLPTNVFSGMYEMEWIYEDEANHLQLSMLPWKWLKYNRTQPSCYRVLAAIIVIKNTDDVMSPWRSNVVYFSRSMFNLTHEFLTFINSNCALDLHNPF